MAGLFVTFEGIDRSGKTTQARLLCEALGPDAVAVREPGGTAVGERVRELLKDPAAEISAEAEALLFAAAGAELQQRVLEAYERLAAAEPERWRRIDADRPPEEVHADVLAEVEAARAAGARA